MSGLEPLAALGLACNVFQVVSFAGEIWTVCKALYDDGEVRLGDSDITGSLDGVVDSLNRAFHQVESSVTTIPSTSLTDNDREIIKIARECRNEGIFLKGEIDKLIDTTQTKGRRGKSLLKAVKVVLSSRINVKRLGRSEKTLRMHQKTLETRLLLRICDKTDAVKLCQQESFNNLDSRLRAFIAAFSEGETRISALLSQESSSIKNHTTIETKKLETTITQLAAESRAGISYDIRNLEGSFVRSTLDSTEKARRERLLRSLKYATMNERRNQIADPHTESFQWIFEDPPNSEASELGWDDIEDFHDARKNEEAVRLASSNFLSWLASPEQPLFWISGKPGSGKSTLMKFLVQDPRTKQHLTSGLGPTQILSHFIWSAGQPIEGRIKGILCSLLYQLFVAAEPNSLQSACETFPEITRKDTHSDWSDKELQAVVEFVIQSSSVNLCIFLDGLDEVHPSDGQISLLKLVKDLCKLRGLKACVSSRPEPILKRNLNGLPTFRIHDLTARDIQRYASSMLLQRFSSHINSPDSSISAYDLKKLHRELCNRAEGVFLWVALALRSLQDGSEKGDSLGDLHRRIQLLQTDLKDLFGTMWDRLGVDKELYQKDAAIYLNLVLTASNIIERVPWRETEDYSFTNSFPILTVLDVVLATDPVLTDELLAANSDARSSLSPLCRDLAKRIEVRCGGLVEVTGHSDESMMSLSVVFVHRSAKEFLTTSVEGDRLLRQDTSVNEDRVFNLVKAWIARTMVGFSTSGLLLPPPIVPRFSRNLVSLLRYITNLASLLPGRHSIILSWDRAMELVWVTRQMVETWTSEGMLYIPKVPRDNELTQLVELHHGRVDFLGLLAMVMTGAVEKRQNVQFFAAISHRIRVQHGREGEPFSAMYNAYLLHEITNTEHSAATSTLVHSLLGQDLKVDFRRGGNPLISSFPYRTETSRKPTTLIESATYQCIRLLLNRLVPNRPKPNSGRATRTYLLSLGSWIRLISRLLDLGASISENHVLLWIFVSSRTTYYSNLRLRVGGSPIGRLGTDRDPAVLVVTNTAVILDFLLRRISSLDGMLDAAVVEDFSTRVKATAVSPHVARVIVVPHVPDERLPHMSDDNLKSPTSQSLYLFGERPCYATTDERFTRRMLACLEQARGTSTIADGNIRMDGLQRLVDDIMENTAQASIGLAELEDDLVVRDVLWRPDDERNRPPPYW